MEVEEEKKPFDAEVTGNEEETQPDPDEQMMMDQATGRVWIVKVRQPHTWQTETEYVSDPKISNGALGCDKSGGHSSRHRKRTYSGYHH